MQNIKGSRTDQKTKAEKEYKKELEEQMTKEELKVVDRCALSPLERQKVKDSWLAVPKEYKIPTIDNPPLPKKSPYGLSIPALKAKCSPHTEKLAVAKVQLPKVHYVTKAEKEYKKELEEQMTKEELKWLYKKTIPIPPSVVSKAALKAKITPRIETMALARLTILNETKRRYFSRLNTNQKNAINRYIKEHYDTFKANYPPESDTIYVLNGGSLVHASCTGKTQQKGGKRVRCICELNKNQRKTFRKRMKQMGAPKKPIVPDKGPDRGPKKKIKDFEPWLTLMSQPKYPGERSDEHKILSYSQRSIPYNSNYIGLYYRK
ncbi:hypothetical protein Phum_PHUM420880 [Pediculus humanus corporis]|uniref:Uncharacterized protein n=1 Tax=Pediculus humanus subsp. corporis TaxID=121224 RepID=E0VSN5_PEDHC|nr:uncharacterized protein Phum_PHUM420880 [Pediculus humanus corporis]EEB16391.1 hypothetical protein Phum_PHUM420880 [Pediculus humanus corporis]